MVARLKLDWPQICDGKARNSEVVRLFNGAGSGFWGFPRMIVLDREGHIVLNHLGSQGIPKVTQKLEELLGN
jgi:hypothetical protein